MFDEFLEALDDNPFEEFPVGVREFVEGEKFLNHPPLSEIQYDAVECMSQIYKLEDLQRFMPYEQARRHYDKYTKSEVILQLGKGCHAPTTPVYDPMAGWWREIAEHDGAVLSEGRATYATEPFQEGFGPMHKVTFGNNMHEIVYGEHKYLAARKRNVLGEREFVAVKDLKPGDRVVWNRHYPVISPENMDEKDVEILALATARYEATSEAINFKVHYSKKDLARELKETWGAVSSRETATITNMQVTDPYFVETFKRFGLICDNEYKRLPLELFRSDDATIAQFLDDAFMLVGGIGKRSHSRHGFYLRWMPVGLAEDVAHAMMRIGVLPTVELVEEVFMYGPDRVRMSVFADAWPHNKIFADLIGVDIAWNNENDSKVRKSATALDDVYLVPVKSIEEHDSLSYWSKTVPDTGNYVGNGPISANSGKDLLSTVAVSYVVYKLLCLKDPARYYGKPSGDAIDIINIAINAQQAKNVFFKGLKNKIGNSPWFIGKYMETQESISFNKSITAYSGHSERESHEGLNLIMAVLDEISGFGEGSALNEGGKSAKNIYDAFRASVDSRFPGGVGCVALLSFPRHRNDFITMKYDSVVAEKEVIEKEYTYIINPDLPPTEDNLFKIDWEEDHIQSYILPDIWAIKRPSWDVNPTRTIEDYKNSFVRDPIDALQRFACMPTDMSTDSFFRNIDKIDAAMVIRNPVDRSRHIDEAWKPDPNVTYYVHADLAQQQDKCAVALAHVEKWTNIEIGNGMVQTVPHVVVDMLAWWEPKVEGPVDLSEVKRWIIDLRKRDINLGLITFDRWGSFDLIRELNDRGYRADTLSVAKKHYEDLAMMLYEERVFLPRDDTLKNEMLALKVVKNKVDHPRKASKDLCDAVVGAAYNAITMTPRNINQTIEVHTWSPSKDKPKEEIPKYSEEERAEVRTWLRGMGMI